MLHLEMANSSSKGKWPRSSLGSHNICGSYTGMQKQTAVTAYFKSEQLLLLVLARGFSDVSVSWLDG